jgi:hypothetical protein
VNGLPQGPPMFGLLLPLSFCDSGRAGMRLPSCPSLIVCRAWFGGSGFTLRFLYSTSALGRSTIVRAGRAMFIVSRSRYWPVARPDRRPVVKTTYGL